MRDAILRRWYGQPGWLRILWPLELIFIGVVRWRRMAYERGWIKRIKLPVPVIVVGNLSVGGNGKTPLVLALAEHLQAAGWHPGIISRGYGSAVRSGYHEVKPEDDPVRVGDEPLLLARRSAVPVYIGPDRPQVAKALLQAHPLVNVLISDDGLQHYALDRDLDIVVMDAQRRLGNGHLLPVGPLREPGYRLREFCVIYHGDEAPLHEFRMQLQSLAPVSLDEQYPWSARLKVAAFAGIGNPQRFFAGLRAQGYDVEEHARPDHHRYSAEDFAGLQLPVLMTEKDAVKCKGLAPAGSAFVPVVAMLPLAFWHHVEEVLNAGGKQHAR